MISYDKRIELFESLHEWALLSRKELENYCNEENIEVVRLLVSELADENILPDQVTPGSFADLVYKLREYERTGSRRLGDAIISAGMAADNGDIETAIKILEDFREKSPSAFYKQIALNQIENFKMGNI
jgi:hypothetical protein